MPAISVNTDGDHQAAATRMGAHQRTIIHTTDDWLVDCLEHGMQSGATSLMVMIPATLENVDVLVMAETSLQCWMMAASVIAAAHRDEVEQPGWARLSPAARQLLLPRLAEAVRRAIPTTTPEQATTAAAMIIDSYGADAPPDLEAT